MTTGAVADMDQVIVTMRIPTEPIGSIPRPLSPRNVCSSQELGQVTSHSRIRQFGAKWVVQSRKPWLDQGSQGWRETFSLDSHCPHPSDNAYCDNFRLIAGFVKLENRNCSKNFFLGFFGDPITNSFFFLFLLHRARNQPKPSGGKAR